MGSNPTDCPTRPELSITYQIPLLRRDRFITLCLQVRSPHCGRGRTRTSRTGLATVEMVRDGGRRQHTCEGLKAQVPKENRTGPVRRRRGGGGARPTTGPRASGVREHDSTPVKARLTPACVGNASENPATADRGPRTSSSPLRGSRELHRSVDVGKTRWDSGQSQASRQGAVKARRKLSPVAWTGDNVSRPVQYPRSRWDPFIPHSLRERCVSSCCGSCRHRGCVRTASDSTPPSGRCACRGGRCVV